jgi:hypothetical protein
MRATREVARPDWLKMGLDDYSDRSATDWLEVASDTLQERGLDYGDPRNNLLRIYKIARLLGVQLRDPSDIANVFLATKLSRIVESPGREDSYLDLIGYAGILAQLRFTTPDDWSDIEFDAKLEQ